MATYRRSSHEERGLKYGLGFTALSWLPCRSSHEERGLKSHAAVAYGVRGLVAPRMRSVD